VPDNVLAPPHSEVEAPPERPAVQPVPVQKVIRSGDRKRILAVDDDRQVLRLLRRFLGEAGYDAIVTNMPGEASKLVEIEEPDVVLLDLMFPETSGIELVKQIREFSNVPVIVLTASDKDTVEALNAGGDDYITKPFSPTELVARIETALRRHSTSPRSEVRQSSFTLNGLVINFAERLVSVEGEPVSLSAMEYKLLYEFATNAGRVLTYEQILQRVWGPEYSGETELVRSMARHLRRKLGDEGRNPRYIFNESQIGYRMPKPENAAKMVRP